MADRNRDLLIGLDLGTSAIKGILVSAEGSIIAEDKALTDLNEPQPGFVEFSPVEHYRNVCDLIGRLGRQAPRGSAVRAISMAAASGNSLLTDADGSPLTPVISWMDTRVMESIGEILPDLDVDGVHEVVGWPFLGMFPLAHFGYFRRSMPDAWKRAEHYCMSSDYILHCLTGRWGMDPSTATTFYLRDQVKGIWHEPYLEMLGITKASISPLMPSGTVLGRLTKAAAKDTGLDSNTEVVLGAFDHPSAARGTGNFVPGDLLLSCGTSWVGFYPVADRDLALSQKLLVDPFLTPDGPWGAIFSIPCIGTRIDRYVDSVALEGKKETTDRYLVFNSLAQEAPRGANGLFIDPSADPEDNDHTGADISRAVMEGVAFLMREGIEELAASGIAARRVTMVGGSAESPIWPQILADVIGVELEMGYGQTAGALGAAVLAGIGVGLYRDAQEGSRAMKVDVRTICPDGKAHEEYTNLFEQFKKHREYKGS